MTDTTGDLDAFFETMRDRFALASDALDEIHKEALDDFKFRLGDQWDAAVAARRKADGRPVYTVNRLPQFLRQVSGAQKQARPAIQIAPLGDGSDVETAEIAQGIVRHIERQSDAEEAYDTAFDHMITGGFGYFRLLTDYCAYGDDDHQEARFEREINPFAHFPDPTTKKRDYSDAKFWFVVDWLTAEQFEREYPDSELAGLTDFTAMGEQAPGWLERDGVRVAEYFWVTEESQTVRTKKGGKRKKTKRTVHWCKTNGVELLEPEQEIPGSYIPIVPVLGEELLVEGRRHLIGLVRYARTPQQLYNLWQSAMAEAIALAPKVPWVGTAAQFEGYSDIWRDASNSNYPYLPYNPDPKAPGPPERTAVEPPIVAITEALGHADNDLKAVMGLFDASLGERGPDESGKAILLRKQQGDGATFGFQDALKPAIKHAGRILVGWIPAYYDVARVVRIVNPDETSDLVKINQPFQDDKGLQKLYDLSVGSYDVDISSGPSFATARQEAAQSIMALIQAEPALMQTIGDLLIKNFDWPMAQEISERLKKLLPPALQDDGDGANAQQQLSQMAAQNQQLSTAVHALSAQLEQQQVQAASKERIALIQAKAMIDAAALKAKSQEGIVAFEADREQIDRQLEQIPDPALDQEAAAQQGQQQHEARMQASQQAHEQSMAQQAQQAQEAAAKQAARQPAKPRAK